MAEREFVLCEPLCFFANNFSKMPLKAMKIAAIDFFDVESIVSAKQQLLNDIGKLNLDVFERPQHVPARREGVNRTAREVDDILQLFTDLDEKKHIDKLPKYVCDKPENVPSSRLFSGDLKLLTTRLDKMEDKLDGLVRMMNIIVQLIDTGHKSILQSAVRVINSQSINEQRGSDLQPLTNQQCFTGSLDTAAKADGITTANTTATTHSWATSVMLTAESADSVTDSQSETHDDIEPFQRYVSPQEKKRNRKRRRQRSQPQPSVSDAVNPLSFAELAENLRVTGGLIKMQPSVQQQQQRQATSQIPRAQTVRRPLMVGTGSSNTQTSSDTQPRVQAASQPLWKAVYCVDNIATTVTETDLKDFVTGLGVQVVSCFEVRPRRAPWQVRRNIVPDSRKTFRLCIRRQDDKKLLNAASWPSDISISKWFFKSSTSAGTTDKNEATEPTAAAAETDAMVITDEHDADKTVLYSTTDTPPGHSGGSTVLT